MPKDTRTDSERLATRSEELQSRKIPEGTLGLPPISGLPPSSSGRELQFWRDAYFNNAVMHMKGVLLELGFDVQDENFVGTPERFVKYLLEYHNPHQDLEGILKTGFSQERYEGMVVQTNIPFRTICPHHLLPVIGKAHVGYISTTHVVGLSKLTRIVHAVGIEKPRMQEDITDILADLLMTELKAKGSIVVISAEHMCMSGRGVAAYEVPTMTSSVRGVFREVGERAREEFFALLKTNHIR
jgi:GTP cyclohydrolase I